MTYSEEFSEKVQICREIYLKHGGQKHELIEQEMRYLGYHDFHRRSLYTRFERGTRTPGWIETYGWRGALKQQQELHKAATKSSPPYSGVPAAASASGVDIGAVADASSDGVVLSPAQGQHCMEANAENHPPATAVPLLREVSPLADSQTPHSALRIPHSEDFDEFKSWLKRTWPGKNWEWKHLVHIYKHLKRVWDGDCKRLMIFLPPRHGKSELVTVRFPAWTLKHNPETKVIIGCYNQPLANRFSRMVRSSLAEDAFREKESNEEPGTQQTDPEFADGQEYQKRDEPLTRNCGFGERGGSHEDTGFSFRRKDSEAEWETVQGGGVRAVGVGAGITGYGAHLIVIDDPVKSRAEAESETCRERVWNWFNDDVYTRLEPDGKIILIQTRWHEDDLAGRLLREAQEGGEQWEVINLPALAEPEEVRNSECRVRNDEKCEVTKQAENTQDFSPTTIPHSEFRTPHSTDPLGRAEGEALCPERYDEKKLARIRRKIGSYSFAALYQQRPAPAEGGQFKRAWFRKIIDAAPEGLAWKRGYDLAVSTKQTADYTASFRCAKDQQGNLYIADGFRARIEYPDQRRYILGRMQTERSTEHGIEAALHGQAFVQDLRRELGPGRFAFRAVRVAADKLTRALAWLNLAEEGKLYLVRGPWIDAFVDEVARFPTGRHDDQIDAVSLAVNMLQTRRYRSMGF